MTSVINLNRYIGFASLLEAKMVDIEVPEVLQKPKSKQRGGRPKGGPKQNVLFIFLRHDLHIAAITDSFLNFF